MVFTCFRCGSEGISLALRWDTYVEVLINLLGEDFTFLRVGEAENKLLKGILKLMWKTNFILAVAKIGQRITKLSVT